MQEEFQIGAITSSHGVKGEVKVFPTTDEPEKFRKLKKVTLRTPRETKDVEIESAKFFKNMVILKIKDVNDRDQADRLKQATLWVGREDAVKLKKNEYYRGDLIGMSVYTEDGELFGELTDVLDTGANDVYAVKRAETGEEVYLPAIKQCILNVEPEENRMTVHIMEGLLS